ncbi:MAG: hypothetical protein AAFX92_14725, partial [Pseudomonadota bacterium]
MTVPIECRLVGTWRITEADLWDHDYLDLCGRATLVSQDDGKMPAKAKSLLALCRPGSTSTSADRSRSSPGPDTA